MVGRRWTRRALLADLGRVTLGAVVVGGLAGCTDADGDAGGPAASPGPPATGTGTLAWRRAAFGFVSAYVLVRDGEALVFDTGTGPDVGPAGVALEAAGVGWQDVAHVLVSHRHGDHLGGLDAVLRETPEAAVHAARPDLEAVRAVTPRAGEVVDGDELLGVRVVATPGHTPGHVSAFAADAGLLLAGDALVNGARVGGSPPDFTDDATAAATSVGVLAALAPRVVLFGHGDPLEADAATRLADLAASS